MLDNYCISDELYTANKAVGRVTSFEPRITDQLDHQDENCETSNHFSISGNWFSSPDLLMATKMAEKCEITSMKVNRGRTKQSPVYRTDASFASLFQPYYITCYYVKHMRRKRKATWSPQQ
ncbi:hypothetical protein T07_112 [Trichinella nelsoni]|uniref:Uncharacterized protein n=1 Tax=Trichinella nelsoni TaxID=6336 RepID=A0A0V0RTV3_9BILA|nr:hypothetical protein T07_112 [Trichinella nelsoni]